MTPSTTVRPGVPGAARAVRPGTVAAVVVVAAAFTWLPTRLGPPPTVERLTVVNPTPYRLRVDVDQTGTSGWLLAGTVAPGETAHLREVLDMGDTWVVRFSGQGRDGGAVAVGRDDLEAGGWQLVVPNAVGDRLADLGAPPSP